MIVALRDDYRLERTSAWDALGMRGTCSDGFCLCLAADLAQILPTPFADIASQTMLPVSHLLWSSVWLGIAADAVARARAYLRQQARGGRGTLSPGGYRLARATSLLQLMQSRLSLALKDYEATFADGSRPLRLGSADMNNLKTSVSELCLEVTQHAFMICGINGYRNGTVQPRSAHPRPAVSADHDQQRPDARKHRQPAADAEAGLGRVLNHGHPDDTRPSLRLWSADSNGRRRRLYAQRPVRCRGGRPRRHGRPLRCARRAGGLPLSTGHADAALVKSGYLKSFPQLLGTIHCFCGNEAAHRALLRRIDANEDGPDTAGRPIFC